MTNQIIVVDPLERPDILRALASEVRVRILEHLTRKGPRNVNQVAEELDLPQSTVSSNIQILVDVGLVQTRSEKGRKGSQKICLSTFTELLIAFKEQTPAQVSNAIEVAMPIGLYTRCEVSAPCGLCSPEGVIGLLDVPDTFLDPDRMRAGLLWFTRGFVEIVRGLPLLTLVLIGYFVIFAQRNISELLDGLGLGSKMFAGIALLSVFTAAYLSEILRGGLESIPQGQIDSARAVGFNRFQVLRYVILPQVESLGKAMREILAY